MEWFDDSGQRVAVDHKNPIDDLEPEADESVRADLKLAEIVFRIGATFREGDPKVTCAAWAFLLRGADGSMRRRAKALGVTTAALSKRARILAESFGLDLTDPHIRELRRRLATEAWARRKRRRADRSQPAAHLEHIEATTDQGGAL